MRMKARISQASVVAVLMLGGLLVCCPMSVQGARLGNAAGGKGAQAKERFQDIVAQLQLTAHQKQELKPIPREEGQKLKALWAETGTAKRVKHAQLKQIHQEFVARVRAVLTPEQFAKWQTLRGELHAQHQIKGQSKALGL